MTQRSKSTKPPAGNIMLGNVLTQGQIGGELRVGYNIPDDFGTTLMRGLVHLPPPRPPADADASKWGVCVAGMHSGHSPNEHLTILCFSK